MSLFTRERDLEEIFGAYGKIEKVDIIRNRGVSAAASVNGEEKETTSYYCSHFLFVCLFVCFLLSQRSRGFGFIYFERQEDAEVAKEKANGMVRIFRHKARMRSQFFLRFPFVGHQ